MQAPFERHDGFYSKRPARIRRQGRLIPAPSSALVPLTNFPANTYDWRLSKSEVPGTVSVVGRVASMGAPQSVATPQTFSRSRRLGTCGPLPQMSPAAPPPPPSMENERMLYAFRVEKPQAAGTFVAAPLQLSPVQAEGNEFFCVHDTGDFKHGTELCRHARAHP